MEIATEMFGAVEIFVRAETLTEDLVQGERIPATYETLAPTEHEVG